MVFSRFFFGLTVVLIFAWRALAAEPMDVLHAAAKGADWLAAHQLKDGSWSFDHRLAPACEGKCGGQGTLTDTRNAATAMAVLALISAGHGDKDAAHGKELKAGFAYLTGAGKKTTIKDADRETLTFEEPGGTMYSHGLATLALCEGFRATGDMSLREPAQQAIDHIVLAQDPAGGGWRYLPRQVGDTSVSGWQIAALLSGEGAMLEIPGETFAKTHGFLDSVQSDGGAKFGYIGPGAGQATTAIGLLSRRRLGWKVDQPEFVRGIEFLLAMGPSKANLYYDFYATQALRHADDASWNSWREKMNPLLLDVQAKDAHAEGSWGIVGDHGSACGGRVYSTAMATMILSVESGKLPMFKK